MKTIIGIDPGLSGAVAIGCPVTVTVHPTPTSANPRGKGRILDGPGMRDLLDCHDDPYCFIEAVRAMPKQGVTSMMTIGVGFGMWIGLLVGLRIPYEVVQPRAWQRRMLAGCAKGDTKAASVVIAKRLFPRVSLRRTDKSRVDDHNLADALLIAEYGRRTLGAVNA